MNKYQNREFDNIINPLLNSCPFELTKNSKHHGITRYEHSVRVAYFSYIITKLMGLDYKETTKAAMLHDFFTTEVEDENAISKLRRHPNHALENSKKYFKLSDKQVDIISTHMFPVTFTPPKYLESWIVDLVDDVVSIYERGKTMTKELKTVTMFVLAFLINYIKIHL